MARLGEDKPPTGRAVDGGQSPMFMIWATLAGFPSKKSPSRGGFKLDHSSYAILEHLNPLLKC